MNERSQKFWMLTSVLAMTLGVLVLAESGSAAQVTGGQATAAQAAAAQARTPAPQAAAASSQAAPARPAAPATAAGRRDPFRPLVVKGQSEELPARLPPGKAGLVIGQLVVQGIVRGLNGEWIAVVDNKTKRAFFLYVGDELYNGTVSRITADTVVFDERVLDAQGRMITREVVKRLNPS